MGQHQQSFTSQRAKRDSPIPSICPSSTKHIHIVSDRFQRLQAKPERQPGSKKCQPTGRDVLEKTTGNQEANALNQSSSMELLYSPMARQLPLDANTCRLLTSIWDNDMLCFGGTKDLVGADVSAISSAVLIPYIQYMSADVRMTS